MKSTILTIAFMAFATPALAASPFDGTWKTDLAASKFSQKPDVYLLQAGSYACKTCTPPVTVPADGAFHAVAGHDYYDAVAVKVVSAGAVTTTLRKGGKTVATNEMTVSADGRTMTAKSHRINIVTGASSDGAATSTRVAAAPAGAHAVSGSWQTASVDAVSDSGLTQTLKVDGDALTLSTPTGEGYTATFGGPPVVQVYDMTVAPDGRTMTMVVSDKRNGSTDTIVMTKQ